MTTTPETNRSKSEVLPPLQNDRPASGWSGYVLAAIGAIVSALYLANIGVGIFELIPDALPGIGNLDEVFFSALLIFCLRKLGIDLLPHLRKSGRKSSE